MTKNKLLFLVLVALFSVLTTWSPASAQDFSGEELPPGVTEEDVLRVASKLYCEVCEGVPLSACPSVTCSRWRQEIANLLGEGQSDEEIMTYFAERYGDEVTGVPLRGNQRYIALFVPAVLALLLGMVIGYQVWQRQEQSKLDSEQTDYANDRHTDYNRPVPDDVDPNYLERLMRTLEE